MAGREYLMYYAKRLVKTKRNLAVAQRFDAHNPNWAWPANYGKGFKGRTKLLEFLYGELADVMQDVQKFLDEYANRVAPLPARRYRRYSDNNARVTLGEGAKKSSLK